MTQGWCPLTRVICYGCVTISPERFVPSHMIEPFSRPPVHPSVLDVSSRFARGRSRFLPSVRSLAMVVAISAVFLTGQPVGASMTKPAPPKAPSQPSLRDLQQQRESVRSKKADAASQVNVLQATDQELTQALSDLSDNLNTQTALAEDAQKAQAQAETDAAAAQTALDTSEAELVVLKGDIKNEAIEAYINASDQNGWSILSGDNPNDALNRATILAERSSSSMDSAERYRSVQEDLGIQRRAKTDAAARAAAKKLEASGHLDALAQSQAQQEQFQQELNNRIDGAQAEADALASFDSALSSEITDRQAKLVAEIAARQRQADAARVALTKSGRTYTARSTANGPTPTFSTSGGSGIVNVQGINVAASLQPGLNALLNDARAAGINFSGGGYRDPAQQIAVRRNNCGTSNYAIYQAPSSSCRPPTAPPGRSQHELGLAVDFSADGRILSRGSAGYQWLAANASRYGLFNLPSEPWHWSANGN